MGCRDVGTRPISSFLGEMTKRRTDSTIQPPPPASHMVPNAPFVYNETRVPVPCTTPRRRSAYGTTIGDATTKGTKHCPRIPHRRQRLVDYRSVTDWP